RRGRVGDGEADRQSARALPDRRAVAPPTGLVVRRDRGSTEPAARHREGPDSPGARAAQGSHPGNAMKLCPHHIEIQDWLDGALPAAEAERFTPHLAACPECAAEVAAFQLVFSELRALPLLDPRPELFERIMDQVLPQRLPRWVRVLGWAYGFAFLASLAAIA